MATGSVSDPALFHSAAGMAEAQNYADWTFSLFAPYVHGAVLEVGCGVGTFTKRLAQAPALSRLLSIDVSEAAVSYCQRTIQSPTLELRHAAVDQIVSEQFDLVVCMNVLEHIEDDCGALRAMLGLLRPGGTLFLLVPAHGWLYTAFDVESGHWRRYSKRRMKELILRAAPDNRLRIRQFYFNTIGAVGYFVVYTALRRSPREGATAEIGLFDRYAVPIQRRLEPRSVPFGISLVAVLTRGAEARP